MFKYLIAILGLVFGALAWMYFYVGVPVIYSGSENVISNIHRMGDKEQSISHIYITAFYFIPKNKKEKLFTEWRSVLEEKLGELVRFHSAQLQEKSELVYDVYPEPIIGYLDNSAYDTLSTQYGNPEALRHIVPEVESRVFQVGGDLYRKDFLSTPLGAYHVVIIAYEGVGAVGGENAALISRTFLTEKEYEAESATLLAHEFYHTLGLPDEYTLPDGVVTAEDIMGLGRYRPITKAYISQKLLQELGL